MTAISLPPGVLLDAEAEAALRAGVMTIGTAVRLHGRSTVRAHIRAHRWQRPTRSVVVTHNGSLSNEQREWVALLSGPPGSALGGLTAAGREGFHHRLPVARPVLVIPSKARKPSVDADIWYSKHLGTEDVHPARHPRRTRPARSLIDAAADRRHAGTARAIILAGVQQRLVTPGHLEDTLLRRPACRHHAVVAESIADATGGIQSVPEKDFDDVRRRRRLPEPTRQRVLRREDGAYYLDAEWEAFSLSCEVHGQPHMEVVQWDRDLDRANEIVIAGPHLLVFTSYAVRHMQRRVGDQLMRALRKGGWRG